MMFCNEECVNELRSVIGYSVTIQRPFCIRQIISWESISRIRLQIIDICRTVWRPLLIATEIIISRMIISFQFENNLGLLSTSRSNCTFSRLDKLLLITVRDSFSLHPFSVFFESGPCHPSLNLSRGHGNSSDTETCSCSDLDRPAGSLFDSQSWVFFVITLAFCRAPYAHSPRRELSCFFSFNLCFSWAYLGSILCPDSAMLTRA